MKYIQSGPPQIQLSFPMPLDGFHPLAGPPQSNPAYPPGRQSPSAHPLPQIHSYPAR